MAKELTKTEAEKSQPAVSIEQAEDAARVLILGGLEENPAAFQASVALQEQLRTQDLLIGALHQGDMAAALWLMQAGVSLVSLAA